MESGINTRLIFSGGMKKRVGLARALIMNPEIILFDEPTTGLDPIRKNAVLSMISHMQQKLGFTGVVVSHEIPDIFHISQKILMLDNGKMIADCSPDQLEKVDNPIVHEFINGSESLRAHLADDFYKKNPFTINLKKPFAVFTKTGESCSAMLFRVNHLEEINENYGFVIGQKVVQHLETNVMAILKLTSDNLRHYGDLIVVIIPIMGHEAAEQLVANLKEELQKCPSLAPQGVSTQRVRRGCRYNANTRL